MHTSPYVQQSHLSASPETHIARRRLSPPLPETHRSAPTHTHIVQRPATHVALRTTQPSPCVSPETTIAVRPPRNTSLCAPQTTLPLRPDTRSALHLPKHTSLCSPQYTLRPQPSNTHIALPRQTHRSAPDDTHIALILPYTRTHRSAPTDSHIAALPEDTPIALRRRTLTSLRSPKTLPSLCTDGLLSAPRYCHLPAPHETRIPLCSPGHTEGRAYGSAAMTNTSLFSPRQHTSL